MGGLISKPVTFVSTKVHNARKAVENTVSNTKNAVTTRVNNSKNAVVTYTKNIKDGTYSRAHGVKTSVLSKITNVKNGVSSQYTNIKQGVVTRIENTRNVVIQQGINVKTKYTNTRDAVATRVNNAKDRVHGTLTSANNAVKEKYRRLREIKLSRKQKVLYGLGFILTATFFILNGLLLYDVYTGDYEGAKLKVELTTACVSAIKDLIWQSILQCCQWMSVALHHIWTYTCIALDLSWQGMKWLAGHVWHGMKVSSYWLYTAVLVTFDYTFHMATILWQYLCVCIKILGEYCYAATVIVSEYLYAGAVIAGQGIAAGSTVVYERGSVILRGGFIELLRATRDLSYFLAWGSYEAIIYTGHALVKLFNLLWVGTTEGSVLLWNGSIYVVNQTYHGSITASQMTRSAYNTTVTFVNDTSNFAYYWSHLGVTNFIYGSKAAWNWSYETATVVAQHISEWTVIVAIKVTEWTVDGVTKFAEWSQMGVTAASHALYTGLNQYLLKSLVYIGNVLWQIVLAISLLIGNFLVETFTKFFNFIYVFGTHIYNILYILVAFVFQIVCAILGAFKLLVSGLVVCVTSVFSAVIWVLEETVFAYMFMLHKYNMYREMLFFGFIGLITLYCTGLLRDRRQAQEEGEESDSEEEDEDFSREFIDGLMTTPEAPTKGVPADLPPAYKPSSKHLHPSSVSKPTPTFSDLEDSDCELEPDQEVPDFMNLSDDSEPEPSPCPSGEAATSDSDGEAERLALRVSALKTAKAVDVPFVDEFALSEEHSGTESNQEDETKKSS